MIRGLHNTFLLYREVKERQNTLSSLVSMKEESLRFVDRSQRDTGWRKKPLVVSRKNKSDREEKKEGDGV